MLSAHYFLNQQILNADISRQIYNDVWYFLRVSFFIIKGIKTALICGYMQDVDKNKFDTSGLTFIRKKQHIGLKSS